MQKQTGRVTVVSRMSYGPEREKLNKEFTVKYLKPGTVVSFEDISAISGINLKDMKTFKAMLLSWRKVLRNKNIFTGVSFRDQCLRVLTDDEKADSIKGKVRSMASTLERATQMFLTIDPAKLSEAKKRQLELDKRVLDGIQDAQAKRQITAVF